MAIKVLNEGTATGEASRELLQEGVVMASMDHDNVVRLYALSMGSQMMLVSQFIPMGALISYLKKHKDTLNAMTMLRFSIQIASVSLFVLLFFFFKFVFKFFISNFYYYFIKFKTFFFQF